MTILNYGEEAQRYALERGLSTELLNATSYQDVPETETLAQYVQRLKHLEDNIRRPKALARPKWQARPPVD